jgi:predicted branched-subunit amino acid permease
MSDPVRRKVIRDSLALGLAVGASGLSFGAAAVAAGLSTLQASALSILTFTGGSQFALIGVLGAGGSAFTGTVGALLLGSRNLMYGVRLAALLHVPTARRLLAAQVTIDETTAMAIVARPEWKETAFWTTGIAVFLFWNVATVVGAVSAGFVDTNAIGLDAAVGAVFLALLAPQIRTRAQGRIAIGGALLAAAAIPFTPAGVPVTVAALAILPAVVRR